MLSKREEAATSKNLEPARIEVSRLNNSLVEFAGLTELINS